MKATKANFVFSVYMISIDFFNNKNKNPFSPENEFYQKILLLGRILEFEFVLKIITFFKTKLHDLWTN